MQKSLEWDIINYVTPCLYHSLCVKGWCDIIKFRVYSPTRTLNNSLCL